MDAQTVLDQHLATWDMPTLATQHPEMIAWLADRWEVDFDMVSHVVTFDKRQGTITRHDTIDVREAVAVILRTEIEETR